MALNFPASPTVNQIYTSGALSYRWTGSAWVGITNIQGPIGTQGIQGYQGIGYSGLTSASSLAVSSGAVTFTTNYTQAQSAFVAGTRVRASAASNTANFMEGTISNFSGTSLTVNVDTTAGSGTYASWNFSVAGLVGLQGTQGTIGIQGISGTAVAQGAQGTYGSQGTTTVIIGSVNPDTHPAVTDPINDEFEYGTTLDTTGSRFSNASPWIKEVIGGTNTSETINFGSLKITATNTGTTVRYRQPIASNNSPWEYRTKILFSNQTFSSFDQFGIMVYNLATTKWAWLHILYNGSFIFERALWTGTSFSSASTASPPAASYIQENWIYLSVRFDGTNIYWSWSPSGLDGSFITIFTDSYSSVFGAGNYPDYTGLAIQGDSSSTLYAYCDWFRNYTNNPTANGNLGAITATSYNYFDGSSVGYRYTLDDISSYFDGINKSFPLTYNSGTGIIPKSPNQLDIQIGGVKIYPTKYLYDYVNLTEISVFTRGFYVDSVGNVNFATAPSQPMSFYGTVETNYDPQPTFVYANTPFTALNIMLTY